MHSSLLAMLLAVVLCVCCMLLSGCNEDTHEVNTDPYGFTCAGGESICWANYERFFNSINETGRYGYWAVCINQELQSCSSCNNFDPTQFCDEKFCDRRRCECKGDLRFSGRWLSPDNDCRSRFPEYPSRPPNHGVCTWYISGETLLGYYACNGTDENCRPDECDLISQSGTTKAVCINQTFVSCESSPNRSDRSQSFCDEKKCECEGHRWNQLASKCPASRLRRGR